MQGEGDSEKNKIFLKKNPKKSKMPHHLDLRALGPLRGGPPLRDDPGGLTFSGTVVLDPLHGIHLGLSLCGHSHDPVEESSHLKGIGDRQSGKGYTRELFMLLHVFSFTIDSC